METLAKDAEESARNIMQQTTETLTIFDSTLTSVANFVTNTSMITDVVSNFLTYIFLHN